MPAGKQMVAPFIGLFVGSAMTFRPAMKQAGDSPCVREYQATRLQLLFLLKCICELLTRVVSIIVSINYSKCNLKLVIILDNKPMWKILTIYCFSFLFVFTTSIIGNTTLQMLCLFYRCFADTLHHSYHDEFINYISIKGKGL